MHFLDTYSGIDCSVDDLKEIFSLMLQDLDEGLAKSLRSQPICKATSGKDVAEAPSDSDSLPFDELRRRASLDGGIVRKRTRREGGYVVMEEDAEETETPMTLALKNRSWQMYLVLSDFGVPIPDNLPLEPILEDAVEGLDSRMVRLLIDQGAFPGDNAVISLTMSAKRFIEGDPSEREQILQRFGEILGQLVSAGADVDFIDQASKLTSLGIAAGKVELGAAVLELLNAGANPYCDCQRTFDPILTAAVCSNTDGLRSFVNHSINYPKANHWSAHLASVSNADADETELICRGLEKAGALDMVNEKGQSLLHLAAEAGNCHFIEKLLSHNAACEIADQSGWLPVHHAGFSHHTEAVQCLLPVRSTVHKSGPFSWLTERFNTSTKIKCPSTDILEKQNNSGATMLQVAVQRRNVRMVLHLLDLGADFEAGFHEGYEGNDTTPLAHAAKKGYHEIVSALLSRGANVEAADSHGWRPLHNAAYYGHFEIARALIAAGADVGAETKKWNDKWIKPSGIYGWSEWTGQPLHLAAMGGHLEIFQLLMEHGADVHASTGQFEKMFPGHGPTALHIALDTGTFYSRSGEALDERRLAIAQMLVDNGAAIDGVVDHFTLDDIIKFKDHVELWDALRAGATEVDGVE